MALSADHAPPVSIAISHERPHRLPLKSRRIVDEAFDTWVSTFWVPVVVVVIKELLLTDGRKGGDSDGDDVIVG
jgi:hypothetical protein